MPTFTLTMSWFTWLAYLRKWHPRRYLAGTKGDPAFCKIHSISSPNSIFLLIFFLWPGSLLQFLHTLLTRHLAGKGWEMLRTGLPSPHERVTRRTLHHCETSVAMATGGLWIRGTCGCCFLGVKEQTASFFLIPPGASHKLQISEHKTPNRFGGQGEEVSS